MKITDNTGKFIIANENALNRALEIMAMDTVTLAKTKVPVKKSHLQSSINYTKVNDLNYAVYAGTKLNATEDYARFQEFGGDGNRNIKNYTTPGTGAHFIKDSGDNRKKDFVKYIKQQTNLIKI